jgi:O-antigen ligase
MTKNGLQTLLFLTTALIPISFLWLPNVASITVVIMGILWLACGDWKQRFSLLWANNSIKLMMLLWIWYALGVAWSSNIAQGFSHLEIKLSLVLFPLMIYSRPDLGSKQIQQILTLFAVASGGYAFFLILRSIFSSTTHAVILSSSEFSPWFHPSYLAMYFSMAIVWIGHIITYNTGWKRYTLITLITLLASGIIFTASKINIMLLPIFIVFVIFRLQKTKLSFFKTSLVLASTMLLLGLIVWKTPSISGRFSRMFEAITKQEISAPQETESSAARLLIWEVATKYIIQHPLGSGTGDVNDKLKEAYHKKGYLGLEKRQYNAHNQFLQTGVALGLPGILILVGLFVLPFLRGITPLMTLFLILNLVNSLVEATLETQAGIMFFCFFYCLIFKVDSIKYFEIAKSPAHENR